MNHTRKQFTMNIAWIFAVVLLQDCIRGVLLTNNRGEFNESSSWVDNLIGYIQKTTSGQQVTLLTNLKDNETMETGPSIEKLFTKIVETFRTLRINVPSFNETQEWVLNHGREDDAIFDSSNTFFIFIHYSSKHFDTLSTRKTIDAMVEIAASKLTSQFLLVLVSPSLTDSLEEFLKHAWNHKLLDFTIFEFVETQTDNVAIYADYEYGTPIIHQFNPFKMEYTRTNWTSDTEWFSDKVLDMWGYELKIGVINKPPFTVVTFDEFREPVYVGGANIEFLNIIAKTANFTMKYMPDVTKSSEIMRSEIPDGLFDLMASGKIDLLAYLSPHYTESIKEISLRTTSVRLNKLCTVIPILPRIAMPFSLDFLEAYIVYFGIIVAFWITSYILRFKSKSWYPFNIARTVIGVASVENPKRLSERALYACLVLVAAIFSSSIYTAMTSLSLQTNAEMEISSPHDLAISNLRPEMILYLFNKTFAFDTDLDNLKEKTVTRPGSILPMCPNAAVKHHNTSCLLLNEEAMMVVQNSKRRGRPKLKVTEPCFWTDSTAFMVSKRSPYRSRINDVITLMKDTGIVEKSYNDATPSIRNVQRQSSDGLKVKDDSDNSRLDSKQNMKSLRQQLYAILIIGYALSVLTFIGEIVVSQIVKYRSEIGSTP